MHHKNICVGTHGAYFDESFNFLSSSMDPENLTKPQAYLVYLFYDLNMNLVQTSSGILRVQDPNDLGLLKEEQIIAKEAGYFYTYLMNSSGSEVNFDEYKITYIRPKVRAINHYYPYGLQMYGLDQLDKDYTYKYGGKELQSGDILDNSSTGLELYDIEARYYDPATGLWHVPDPAEQFANPYLAMGNNPVVYVDPDGRFIGMAIFLGATINFMVQGMSGNINSAGDAALALGIGAASGAAGAGVGAGISSALAGGSFGCGFIGQELTASAGFISGAAIGAGAGAAGGFITGAGNTWAGGGSFQQGLTNGLIGAGTGALAGGLMGGISSGLQAKKLDANFWTGTSVSEFELQGPVNSFEDIADAYNNSSYALTNDEYLKIRINEMYSVSEGDFNITKITTKTSNGYGMNTSGHYVNLKSGNIVGGYVKNNPLAGKTSLHISPHTTFTNDIAFRAVAGHELIHAYHYSSIASFSRVYSERIAYKYSYDAFMDGGQFSNAIQIRHNAIFNSSGLFWGNSPKQYQIPFYW